VNQGVESRKVRVDFALQGDNDPLGPGGAPQVPPDATARCSQSAEGGKTQVGGYLRESGLAVRRVGPQGKGRVPERSRVHQPPARISYCRFHIRNEGSRSPPRWRESGLLPADVAIVVPEFDPTSAAVASSSAARDISGEAPAQASPGDTC